MAALAATRSIHNRASADLETPGSGQDDDQVRYVITAAPGTVIRVEKFTHKSTTAKVLFAAAHIGGSIAISIFAPPVGAGLLASTGKLVELEEWVHSHVVGDWESVCDALIALIAAASADELAVLSEPPPPAGFVLVRRYGMPSEKDWVTVGAESTDRDMIRFGYTDRKRQFLAPSDPGTDTVAVYRWSNPKDHDWVSIPDGSISDDQLKQWGYRDKTFSFYGYRTPGPDRVAVYRWWHGGDKDWVTLADGEIADAQLASWGYTSKTFVCHGKRLS